jgi:hypothetical protein
LFADFSNIASVIQQEEYKDSLINFDLKSFLEEHWSTGIITLRKAFPLHYRLLAAQLKLYPKARKKLPFFAEHFCFFTTKSFEQSSSEPLAGYKAKLFSGDILIDLTGGLGVDDWALSRSYGKVISVDKDEELNSIVRMNFEKLNIKNIDRIDADAEEFIKQSLKADLIYIDADRRAKGSRAITLLDSEPPVLNMLSRLFEISERVLLKLSPLVDITYLTKTLRNIEKIHVNSLDNEVKEILVLLKNNFINDMQIVAADIQDGGTINTFSIKAGETHSPGITGSLNAKYFYEPAGCIIKAGLTDAYSAKLGLKKISRGGVYLLGEERVPDFIGRVFRVIYGSSFSKSLFKDYLKRNRIQKANTAKRDFPVSADEIKRQYKISDGGEDYLFFTTEGLGSKVFFHCRKSV